MGRRKSATLSPRLWSWSRAEAALSIHWRGGGSGDAGGAQTRLGDELGRPGPRTLRRPRITLRILSSQTRTTDAEGWLASFAVRPPWIVSANALTTSNGAYAPGRARYDLDRPRAQGARILSSPHSHPRSRPRAAVHRDACATATPWSWFIRLSGWLTGVLVRPQGWTGAGENCAPRSRGVSRGIIESWLRLIRRKAS